MLTKIDNVNKSPPMNASSNNSAGIKTVTKKNQIVKIKKN